MKYCSKCDTYYAEPEQIAKYECPNCGADMQKCSTATSDREAFGKGKPHCQIESGNGCKWA
jgi:predicted RNA-binding Zn-ribbon protein involved in translation (DUF1610 family)